MDILITIITVCRNAEKTIAATMRSVMEQTYPDIEYIIVDGASTDSTPAVIESYADLFSFKFYSEPDQGIYDAMNKGIKYANGEYIQFLNAGDRLIDSNVVQRVVDEIRRNKGDLYYGSIEYEYGSGKHEVRNYGPMCARKLYFFTGDCINHQAIFASKECFRDDIFDLSYQICADREWMMRTSRKGYQFVCVPFVICVYSLDETSTSVRMKEQMKLEADRCIKKHFPVGYLLYCVFEYFRNHEMLSKFLHHIYRLLYIRKTGN